MVLPTQRKNSQERSDEGIVKKNRLKVGEDGEDFPRAVLDATSLSSFPIPFVPEIQKGGSAHETENKVC
jgi:hypothetical protein